MSDMGHSYYFHFYYIVFPLLQAPLWLDSMDDTGERLYAASDLHLDLGRSLYCFVRS